MKHDPVFPDRPRRQRQGAGPLTSRPWFSAATPRTATLAARRPTHLRTTDKHLRTNGSGPEDQLAHAAAGPKDRTHLSNRKESL